MAYRNLWVDVSCLKYLSLCLHLTRSNFLHSFDQNVDQEPLAPCITRTILVQFHVITSCNKMKLQEPLVVAQLLQCNYTAINTLSFCSATGHIALINCVEYPFGVGFLLYFNCHCILCNGVQFMHYGTSNNLFYI